MKHVAGIPLGKQSMKDHIESVEWCNQYIGERGLAWTVVWVGGYMYAFEKEKDALMFTLKFLR